MVICVDALEGKVNAVVITFGHYSGEVTIANSRCQVVGVSGRPALVVLGPGNLCAIGGLVALVPIWCEAISCPAVVSPTVGNHVPPPASRLDIGITEVVITKSMPNGLPDVAVIQVVQVCLNPSRAVPVKRDVVCKLAVDNFVRLCPVAEVFVPASLITGIKRMMERIDQVAIRVGKSRAGFK